MSKTAWKTAEKEFEESLDALGKRAYYHRLTDSADIKGLTGRVSNAASQPSDYIVVHDGLTYFAEVKSTHDETAFRASLLRPSQSAAAKQIIASGGQYIIWCKHVPTGRWYKIPHGQLDGRKSIKWTELTPCIQ